MPRKKLIRRFEPRYGVSREMVEIESKYVVRELEDRSVMSVADLQYKLAKLKAAWQQADQVVEHTMRLLDERTQIAVQCLIVRDIYHVMELYASVIRSLSPELADIPLNKPIPTTPVKDKKLPWSEWLFEPA
jgi:hypothetical protein